MCDNRPHDVSDFDTSAAPVLLSRGAKRYMAVGSKDGILYVYDLDPATGHATAIRRLMLDERGLEALGAGSA